MAVVSAILPKVKKTGALGDVFVVPTNDFSTIGVVARWSPVGKLGLIFAHFFYLTKTSVFEDPTLLSSEKSDIQLLMTADPLRKHFWETIGTLANFRSGEWPVPNFALMPAKNFVGEPRPEIIRYEFDDEPWISMHRYATEEETFGLPGGGVHSSGSVIYELERFHPLIGPRI